VVAPHAPDAMLGAAQILGSEDPPDALFTLLHRLRLPAALSALGMPEDGLDEAARRIMEASRDDPLVTDATAVRQMLDDAFFGRGPRRHTVPATGAA
jgi:maleylacetate reductase